MMHFKYWICGIVASSLRLKKCEVYLSPAAKTFICGERDFFYRGWGRKHLEFFLMMMIMMMMIG